MKKNIDEQIAELFLLAYQNDELYEYLVGLGNYKVVFKDSVSYDFNDIELMERGINTYLCQNTDKNLDLFLNNSLINMINSNDIYKVSIALDFVVYYVKYIKKEQVKFNINLDIILPLLKEKLLFLKQIMIDTKNQYINNSSLWKTVESRCNLYEIRTGRKIL